MKRVVVLILFLFLPLTAAANFEYTLVGKDALVEVKLSLEEIDSFEFPPEVEYSEGKIKYIENHVVEKNGQEYFFVIKNNLFPNSSVSVTLPEGAYINEKYFISPKNYEMYTNGQNIIVGWENSGEKEILIPYLIKKKGFFWIFYLIIGISFILFYFNFKKGKKRKYTQNLFREERQIMRYLIKRKECWTKEIAKELDIPKVRLSRKLRKLEEKGLIEKSPHGNENRIKLKK